MKIFLVVLITFVFSIIVILKLITSPEPVISPDISTSDSSRESEDFNKMSNSRNYNSGKQTHRQDDKTSYRQNTVTEINNLKLIAFVKAYVAVQSYMNKAGSKASYKETRKIVHDHGLSVKDYTKIATLMNESPDFRNAIQKMINEAK